MKHLSNIREGSVSGFDSWYEPEVPGPSADTQGIQAEDISAMEAFNDMQVSGGEVSNWQAWSSRSGDVCPQGSMYVLQQIRPKITSEYYASLLHVLKFSTKNGILDEKILILLYWNINWTPLDPNADFLIGWIRIPFPLKNILPYSFGYRSSNNSHIFHIAGYQC